MSKSPASEITQTISIDQLVTGMYVKSFSDNSSLNIKSEGYISSDKSITQLRKANITQLVIIPAKQKQTVNVEKAIADIKTKKTSSMTKKTTETTGVSLDSEIKKANKLYKNAKSLQEKILEQIKSKKSINVSEAEETTNAMVDSIFRNQDALTCMSRFQTKDSYLIEHSLNVSILMSVFAKHLGFDKRLIQELALGVFLHDIGKILLPNDILNKLTPLNAKEENIIRSHVALGLKIL